ncbi:MAG: hypothetical protein LIO75_09935, partial [Lachnospiraceae bacterium]|nr:hypothetical protein [Lachnospiraceae bacterium]
MFKQSRRNILISIMAILICLFLGILLIIYLSSYHEVAEDNYTMLERYAELYTLEDAAKSTDDTAEPPDDAAEPPDDTAEPPDDA